MIRLIPQFAPGPVPMGDEVLEIGGRQLPYFRTEEFSALLLECERQLLALIDAPPESRAIMLGSSGTGAMDAAVVNLLSHDDRVLVVVGGGFGARLAEICQTYSIPTEILRLTPGRALAVEHLAQYADRGFTALCIQAHETTTGALYDMKMVGEFCRQQGIFLVVDAISSFLGDHYAMNEIGAGATIIGSQKGLALPPGLASLVLSPPAQERCQRRTIPTYYFDGRAYLKEAPRGQTPFTPPVGIILQLAARTRELSRAGIGPTIAHVAKLARHFREGIRGLPYRVFPETPANAVTALTPTDGRSASAIYRQLKDAHDIIVCPNGGELRDVVFRVSHLGYMTTGDLDPLIAALKHLNAHNG